MSERRLVPRRMRRRARRGTEGTEADATDELRRTPCLCSPSELAPEVVGTRTGMFGVRGSGDTSGYGGLVRHGGDAGRHRAARTAAGSTSSPSRWQDGLTELGLPDALEKIVVHRGEITLFVRRERSPRRPPSCCATTPSCASSSAPASPACTTRDDTGRELHAVYHLLSMTHNRRIRLEVTCPDADPHIPSVVAVYPTNDWHERETYDFFGIIFDGHPALTRIQMPDDWPGPPAAQGLSVGRHPRRVQGRDDPAAGHPEELLMTTTNETDGSSETQDPYGAAPVRRPRRAASSPSPARTGTRVVAGVADEGDDRVVVNMGPQHPSTHGVLRLILELEGETVTEARCGIGYLHTGIEKNMEFRSWTQGVTFCTRMDYLVAVPQRGAPTASASSGCSDIEDDIPEKAQVHARPPVELNRISTHLVCIATGGMEIGALTVMTIGFREREMVLDLFELITGLRMNHAFIRPGGVAQHMPPGALDQIRDFIALMKKRLPEYADALQREPDLQGPSRRRRPPRPRRVPRARHDRPGAALDRLPVGPAQDPALLRLRGLRLRRRHLGHLRRLRPLPGPPRRDVGVAEDRRAVRRPARGARGAAGHGRATRRSPGPASSRSAPTAWATASTTSGTSWASRWRR